MECIVKIWLLNDHFSPEYAEAHHKGEESENNRKYLWMDELAITSTIVGVEKLEGVAYPLQGERGGKTFSYSIEDMVLVELVDAVGAKTYIGASRVLIENLEILEGDSLEIRIQLKGEEPLSNPIPGIYIAARSFPRELIVDAEG
jgi:hypothetical protein